jgi:uncharacterized membrane protein
MDVGRADLIVLLAGLLPGVEPRYVLPVAYARLGLLGLLAVALEVPVLAALLTLGAGHAWRLVEHLSRRWSLARWVYSTIERRREKAVKLIERWGLLGLVAFVAVPLPVTGMYTGAVVAMLLGIRGVRLFLALTAGGLISLGATYLPALLVVGA